MLGRKRSPKPEDGNPSLVKAMHELALSDNLDNRKRLYEAFLGSMLWVPVPEVPKGLGPGLQTTRGDIKLQLTGMLDRNNVRVTTVFTDAEALRNWDPNTPYLALKAQDLFRFAMGTDIQAIVINPFDPIRKMIRPGGRITRAEIDLLAKGLVPSRVGPRSTQFQFKANEKVAIGLPATPPSSVVETLLCACAAALPEVSELFLFQMTTQAGTSHTVIGIGLNAVVAPLRGDKIVDRMGTSIQRELGLGQSLDFTFLRGSMADQVRKLGKQIFRKA